MRRECLWPRILMVTLSFLLTAGIALYIHASFFANAFDIRIKEKIDDGSLYYIVAESAEGTAHPDGEIRLRCTREAYDQVRVGDDVFCECYLSSILPRGWVHEFQPARER